MAKEQHRIIDFTNGKIYRLKPNGDCKEIGSKNSDGYLIFGLNGKMVRVHRYLYEKYHNIKLRPDEFINHKNHKRDDNRIENLEVVTLQENNQYRENVLGVHWDKIANKWQAQICFNNENKHIGYFEKFDDARKARKEAEKYYNENHGAKFNV